MTSIAKRADNEKPTDLSGVVLEMVDTNTNVLVSAISRQKPFKFVKEKEKRLPGIGKALLFKAPDDTHILEIKAGFMFRGINTVFDASELNRLISLAKPFSSRLRNTKVIAVSDQTVMKNHKLNIELNFATCLIKRDALIQNVSVIFIRKGKMMFAFANEKRKVAIETVDAFMNRAI